MTKQDPRHRSRDSYGATPINKVPLPDEIRGATPISKVPLPQPQPKTEKKG